jgi:hypothetical protein
MMAVEVKAVTAPKPIFDHGTPTPLFHASIAFNADTKAFQYDVTNDGKRFLVDTNMTTVSTRASAVRTPITVVVNWLKR